VTTNPTLEAHDFCSCSAVFEAGKWSNVCIRDKSSINHVLPIENVPSLFSLALCMRTLPDFLTATMIMRGFLFSGGEFGAGGDDG
jgi:hypothetical protein